MSNIVRDLYKAIAHPEFMKQNAALAEQSAASATALSDQILRLNELVASFRAGGGNIADLRQIAAAMAEPDWQERRRA